MRNSRSPIWVHRAQLPIAVVGLALGIYEIVASHVVFGIIVAVIAFLAGAIAVARLRR